MSKFGWAYVDCTDVGSSGSGSAGPPASLQFVTQSGGGTTGSAYLTFYTASTYSYYPNTMVLSGNLIVTGTISASHYHIEDIAIIDATGSTYFGDSNDDEHIRTGSIVITPAGDPANYALSASVVDKRVSVRSLSGRYRQITADGTIASDDYIIGASASANQTIYLPSASACGEGAFLVIKDEYSNRGGTRIYISGSVPEGGFTIDGDNYYTLTGSMPAVNLYSDGTNWFVF